mmetsp:Transcript_28677/g.47768  ORF Transcript_28677/g.47768 Transcript_28677/m.47768 type:complete len:91 (-) Transcript_28677:211-483(-)
MDSICSWQEEGTSFQIHDRHRFEEMVLPNISGQTLYLSFTSVLNRYGFVSRMEELGYGSFYHPKFRRDGREQAGTIEYCRRQRGRRRTWI